MKARLAPGTGIAGTLADIASQGEVQGRRWSLSISQLAALICLLGFLARLGAYGLVPGPLYPDEDFQYLEQAHRLVFGTGLVPWEYVIGIRSWLLPGALSVVFAAAKLFSNDPSVALWGVAVLLSLLSLPTILCGLLWGFRAAGWAGATAAGVLNAAWFEMAYFAPHALADSVATSLLVPGLYLVGVGRDRPAPRQLFLGGILLGLTVAVRLQLAPIVLLAAVLAFRRGYARAVVIGIALPILFAGLLDAVTLPYPFQSFWLYAWVNVVEGAASSFSTLPWYGYFSMKMVFWSIGAIPLTVAMLIGSWRKPVLLGCAMAIIFPFLLLAHKEDRFILPAVPLLLTLAGIGSAMILTRYLGGTAGARTEARVSLVCGAFWLALSAMVVTHTPLWHYIYERPGMMAAVRIVNADPAACGVAIYPEAPWARMPGYARFKPGLTLYGFSPGDPPGRAAAFDYVIDTSRGAGDLGTLGFSTVACWETATPPSWPDNPLAHVCLWHRPASCDTQASPTLVPPMPAFLAGGG